MFESESNDVKFNIVVVLSLKIKPVPVPTFAALVISPPPACAAQFGIPPTIVRTSVSLPTGKSFQLTPSTFTKRPPIACPVKSTSDKVESEPAAPGIVTVVAPPISVTVTPAPTKFNLF